VADDDGTSATETARGTVERVEPTKAQRAAARRIAESKATAPHLYLDVEVHTGAGATARVVRAVALALREFPRLNGAYRDGAFETYSRINVGVLIEGSDAPVVPTIFDADVKGEPEVAAELDQLAERAGSGALTSPELAGGTFTVATTGVGAIRSLASILTQGQAAALAVGPVTQRALADGDRVVAGPALTATLSLDGRMIGSEEGALFLDRVRSLLEAPD
jgi:pyruvate dehydrogenase E2 component (dihydrolipoamide acetyltransferase)